MATALAEVGTTSRPHLHLVSDDAAPSVPGGTRTRPPRARIVAAIVAVVLLSILVALNGAAHRADALDVTPSVVGHAVVAPGESLWTVAVEHAPPGTDPRRYLAQVQELNDLEDAAVPAWTVVLLPGPRG
ncbi:MAG TPA: hypothetical protein VGV67_00655 [Solirubrobacteraceae bacterium]|nr:hypothetical protein [Solirubrobacteraceae bacterium]